MQNFIENIFDAIMAGRRTILISVITASLIVFLFLASMPTDIVTQTILVMFVYAGLILSNEWRHRRFGKLVFFILIALLSLRYFVWRTFETLGFEGPISFPFMILLYVAEVFGFALFTIGLFVNIAPVNREERPVPPDPTRLPSVDIFVPTYNEPEEVVTVTVAAAAQIDYPADKLNVYVLDDGGTDAKTQSSDPKVREAALERQRLLKNLCKRFGATYMTRHENLHAKAGNVNEAFKRTSGELIVILDADHVPTSDMLQRTVGHFQEREDLFLVQTPHFMVNADPLERNLETFRHMPSENEMFYRTIQKGLDFWDATLFCGSAAVLRRKALEETGGLSTETITEDAETALNLHARGWHSIYLARPMVAGLAPETFSGLIIQRTRWAQGMVQLLMLRNPFLMPGLTLGQRFGYLSSCMYWLFPVARFMFLIAPMAYLFFGLKIYNVSGPEFLVYTVPHFVGSMIYATTQFGAVRWPFIGSIYELMQSLYALPAVVSTFFNPRAPRFKVTPKGETLSEDFVSPLAKPFYFVFSLTALAFMIGFWRWFAFPGEREVLIVVSIWNFFNFISLLLALGTLAERRQLRTSPRMPAFIPVQLNLGTTQLDGHLSDLSIGGARFVPDLVTKLPYLEKSGEGEIFVPERPGHRSHILPVTRIPTYGASEDTGISLCFKPTDTKVFQEIVSLVHGDSQRWDDYWNRHDGPPPVVSTLITLMSAGIRNTGRHFALLWKQYTKSFARQPVTSAKEEIS